MNIGEESIISGTSAKMISEVWRIPEKHIVLRQCRVRGISAVVVDHRRKPPVPGTGSVLSWLGFRVRDRETSSVVGLCVKPDPNFLH